MLEHGGDTCTDGLTARLEISEVLARWVVARDAGLWDQLRTTWHEDGRMSATWFTGSADDFIRACQTSFDAGLLLHHFLGGSLIEVRDNRAVAQTKMSLSQRTVLHGVECDITCTGRFYDFFERRGGCWRIVLRQPVYEKDRLDPLQPGQVVELDRARLNDYPTGCQHLLYAQSLAGLTVNADVPQLRGDRIEDLYRSGATWLAGNDLDR